MVPTDANSSKRWDPPKRRREANNCNCSWWQTAPTKETKHANQPSLWATHRPSEWTPKSSRRDPWDFNRDIYKRRNEIERLFRRLKSYRPVFTRYNKPDVISRLDRAPAFITLALIHDTLKA